MTTFDTIVDPRDGKVYKTVKIGNQVWMAENLRYMPMVVSGSAGSISTPSYFVYEYYGSSVSEAESTDNFASYGVLYNWPAAMAGASGTFDSISGVQGACAPGWHLPGYYEWVELVNYVGGAFFAGGKLKEADTTHWRSPNLGATNELGFTALPGGQRSAQGGFRYIGGNGYWWTASDADPGDAWAIFMSYDYEDVLYSTGRHEFALSVRCVKD